MPSVSQEIQVRPVVIKNKEGAMVVQLEVNATIEYAAEEKVRKKPHSLFSFHQEAPFIYSPDRLDVLFNHFKTSGEFDFEFDFEFDVSNQDISIEARVNDKTITNDSLISFSVLRGNDDDYLKSTMTVGEFKKQIEESRNNLLQQEAADKARRQSRLTKITLGQTARHLPHGEKPKRERSRSPLERHDNKNYNGEINMKTT
jgi:hypothetical protein